MGDILWWHRHGSPRPGTLLAAGETDCRKLNPLDDEDDADAWDDGWVKFDRWRREHPGQGESIRRLPAPEWRD